MFNSMPPPHPRCLRAVMMLGRVVARPPSRCETCGGASSRWHGVEVVEVVALPSSFKPIVPVGAQSP